MYGFRPIRCSNKAGLVNYQDNLKDYVVMAKYTFEMSWNYDEAEYRQFLEEKGITHLKKHDSPCFKAGDALRSRKGLVVRIMERFPNYENCSEDYTIANNASSTEELYENFGYPSIQGRIDMQLQKELQG